MVWEGREDRGVMRMGAGRAWEWCGREVSCAGDLVLGGQCCGGMGVVQECVGEGWGEGKEGIGEVEGCVERGGE